MARLLALLLFFAVPALAANAANTASDRYSIYTHFTTETLSQKPLRVKYTLEGITNYVPADFDREQLTRAATLMFRNAKGATVLAAPKVTLENGSNYRWSFDPVLDAARSGIVAITPGEGSKIDLSFRSNTHYKALKSTFIVEYAPNSKVDPEAVEIGITYPRKGDMKPLMDVFTLVEED